ncbi:MAG: hypothetical protein H6622_16615 [Halobacteriovoraceae bacterium]|nr:hypothetical protein [Halobacteriovoraceae bacterium]
MKFSLSNKFLIFLFSITLASKSLLASGCCGAGASLPNLIVADQKSIISGTLTRERLVGVDSTGSKVYKFKKFTDQEIQHLFGFKASYLLSDYWQTGITLNTVYNTKGVGEDSFYDSLHFGDTSVSIAYEFLPETTYSPIKPRGFVYFKITLPTGESIYDVTNPIDVSGQGFYQSTYGLALVKHFNWGDLSFFSEATNKWSRKVNDKFLDPNYSVKLYTNLDYQISPTMRGGISTAYNYRFPYKFLARTIPSSYHWDLSVSFTHSLGEGYSVGLTYTDQTILGPAKLDPLNRSVSLLLSKSFSL